MIAERIGDTDLDEVQVQVGIETDQGPWVAALTAAGYQVSISTEPARDRS
jgi:hypothetical protein